MAYMLPLRYILASNEKNEGQFDVALCATRIVALMATDCYQARETLKNERRAGTLINAAGTAAVKTAIFLDNGSVVASPLSVRQIMKEIEKANAKEIKSPAHRDPVRLKVYDVKDEEPREDDDEQIVSIASSVKKRPYHKKDEVEYDPMIEDFDEEIDMQE